MTTDAKSASSRINWLWIFGWLLIGIFSCATSSIRHGDTLDVSRYPDDIQAAYKVFAVRCSRCHTLARPLNARFTDPQQWVRYVARMRHNQSSGINAKDGETILRFLLYYMHQRELEQRNRDQREEQQVEAPPSEPPPSAASPETAAPPVAAPPAAVPATAAPAAPSEVTP
jgi:hypothetical protein